MAKREFLMLAHRWKTEPVNGWLASEKLDGFRCFWDGGISRGEMKSDVPYANNAKDERYVTPPIATGTWSRYGNVWHAPQWWLDQLPQLPLDGELWLGRGEGARQRLSEIVKKIVPVDSEWKDVKYMCYDVPSLDTVLADGTISDIHFQKTFKGCVQWAKARANGLLMWPDRNNPFGVRYNILRQRCTGPAVAHVQEAVVDDLDVAHRLKAVLAQSGEGLVLKHPDMTYGCIRSHYCLKVKSYRDDEATVIGYVSGKEGKTGKLLGLFGAMVVEWRGITFELSGFTNEERLTTDSVWCRQNPGQPIPESIEAIHFKRGQRITFTYRECSRDGVPQEAQFQRVRVSE